MAKRTTEEILAQREAWLARKTAREAGEDLPMVPPTSPEEDPEVFPTPETLKAASEPEAAETTAEEAAAPDIEEEAAPPKPEPEAAPPAPQPEEAAQPVDGAGGEALKPQAPKTKRTQEERAAEREAFMAARAAKAAGGQAATESTAAPAAEKEAPAKQAAEESAPAPKPKPKPKPSPKPSRAKKEEEEEPGGPVTRREFLNYAWLASIALFSLETVGISLWFAFPNFREGEFGGQFPIGPATEVLPEVNAPPIPFTDGKFWLVNLDIEGPDGELNRGVQAIYKVCTHLGCLYDWAEVTSRFECPCHGSKFSLTGDYLAGPAPRDLDRFVIQAVSPDGSVKENPNGEPLEINGDEELIVDTGRRILGESHA